MVDIPPKFELEHLMSHTFPGFFSAVSLFMLIDVWSPLDLTAMAIKDISSLGAFIGFVLLIGSILGIIIDGFYHSIIADHIFDKFNSVKIYKEDMKKKCFKDYSSGAEIYRSHHYFIKQMGGDKAITIFQNIINSYYSYARFYSNTFIALIPFSLIVPFYILKIIHISWEYCILLGVFSFFLACFCFYSGYVAYRTYNRALYSAIYGYVGESSEKP
ncbi:hypothetical protein [Candidatus Methanocrinis natronophilus]|uniref:Uncharacterized protein n=1 Tax=Candidatus Methanocrinis natronophilus TaxID=3033396 RepID=A0ABT5X906_9EURY|nr:hypothetical protein [Candidatus Methanocrinis natronophilus]MDF0591143.1 hypothetical protein [Candidatus Methanocrinis natronophilus]